MSLGFDQKEDLRLRMMELEKKLAESEEERCKLEKTCNVLMRAFREEERMHYKALNKKYEKFLEDCTMRRRRNDIILRSLCRVEDRARALFAKTERLKVLKDRYISYLKISDFEKEEKPSLAWKNFQYSSRKIIRDVTPKSVHWKSPYISNVMADHQAKELVEPERTSSYAATDGSLYKSFRENRRDSFESIPTPRKPLEESEDSVKYENFRHKAPSEELVYTFDRRETSKSDNRKSQFENASFNDDINDSIVDQNKNLTKDRPDREINYSEALKNQPEEKEEAETRREKVAFAHQESIEKLKKALSIEDDASDNSENIPEKIIEKNKIEMNEKNSTQKNTLKSLNEDFNRLMISDTDEELKNDAMNNQSDHSHEIAEPKNLPVGLDGIDYQNETYPESYYEQPVHHNHMSITSDVILEEDETEQETDMSDEGAENPSIPEIENGQNNQETGQPSEPKPDKHVITSDVEPEEFSTREEEFIKLDATGFDEQSKKSDSAKSESNKGVPHSNLMLLLESDSESFQIEHPDLAAGNEDSDFDFGFGQP